MQLSRALRLKTGDFVTFTGSGGKTTAMRVLAEELAAQGWRVLISTTTRLGVEQLTSFPAHLVAPSAAQVKHALAKEGSVLVVREVDEAKGKALGFAASEVAAWQPYADVLLVEGDGSKQRPLKAPAAHEPVVPPETTHLVNCVGLWALGQRLDSAAVHRPEILARLLRLSPDTRITPALLARLLRHPEGPARGAPPGARRFLLMNGVDQFEREREDVAWMEIQRMSRRLAAHPSFDAVLLAQLQHQPPVVMRFGKISAIVLAAGAGKRFGGAKQLHPWQGQPLLRHVVMQALAAPVEEVIVVLGAHFPQTALALHGLPIKIVYQRQWQQGQSVSMQAGLRACQPQTEAALFVLGDQPQLPPDLLNEIIDTYRRTQAPIVAPRYGGQRGNPVLFDKALFPELHDIRGDTGGRPLFHRYSTETAWVDAGAYVLEDVDVPGDLEN